jgi:hypothetical protein
MNTRATLGAVVAFAVLLGIVIATRQDKINEGVPKLNLAPLGDVTAIEVTGPNAAKLEKAGDQWKVNGFVTDDAQVKTLLDGLKTFHAQDFVTEKTEKLTELEVDDAKGTKMTLTTATGPGWSLVFGKSAKGGGSYVRDAKSNAIFTTTSPVAWQVKKNVTGWRKKGITTAPVADIVKLTVTKPSEAFTLVNANNTWGLEPKPPPDFRFDPAAAQRLVGTLSNMQAQDFTTDALGEPTATFELEQKDGKKVTVKLGAQKADKTTPLAVDGDPQVYVIGAYIGDQLTKKLDDLRDTSLLAFEPDKVNKLTFSVLDKPKVALAKEKDGWKVVEPKALPAGFEFDPAMVNMQLTRLKNVHAAHLAPSVADAAAGFAKPTGTVELALEGGAKQTLVFGAETPTKELYVKGSVDKLTYSIGSGERQTFTQGVELFKKRPPPPSNMNNIQGLDQLPPEVRRQLEAQMRQRMN